MPYMVSIKYMYLHYVWYIIIIIPSIYSILGIYPIHGHYSTLVTGRCRQRNQRLKTGGPHTHGGSLLEALLRASRFRGILAICWLRRKWLIVQDTDCLARSTTHSWILEIWDLEVWSLRFFVEEKYVEGSINSYFGC